MSMRYNTAVDGHNIILRMIDQEADVGVVLPPNATGRVRVFNSSGLLAMMYDPNKPVADVIIKYADMSALPMAQLKDPALTVAMAPRSGKWARLERIHLAQHPECEVCGTKEEVVGHHVLPFHLFPQYELDPDNIWSLCNSRFHHITFGHLMLFAAYNPKVREDTAYIRGKIDHRQLARDVAAREAAGEYLVDKDLITKEQVLIRSEAKCDALFAAHPEIQ